MKKSPRKLRLHRETLKVLNEQLLPAVLGGARATGDTCLCAPTYWETCEREIAVR